MNYVHRSSYTFKEYGHKQLISDFSNPGYFKSENADSSNNAELLETELFLCLCVV